MEELYLTVDPTTHPSSSPDYQRLSYECLERLDKNMGRFSQCISVTPQEGLLPENKGRQTAVSLVKSTTNVQDKTGINCLAGKVVPNNALLKAGMVFLAAPHLYEVYKIPCGTAIDAAS